MNIGSLLGITAGTAAVTALGKDIVNSYNLSDAVRKSHNNYVDRISDSTFKDWTASDVLREMYLDGTIKKEDYTSGLYLINKIEKSTGSTLGMSNKAWTVFWSGFGSKDDAKQARKLYDKMNAYIPKLAKKNINSIDDIEEAISSTIPYIEDAPGYTPFSEDLDLYQIDVDPLRLWTNQELADFHNVNYDPNYYYDLVKNATDAKVNLARSQIAQADVAAGLQDESNRAAYLDSLRTTKSDAIEKGTSAGARAANELLSNVNALQGYAENRSGLASDNQTLIETPLRNSANYRVTADQYFDSLAQSLMGTGASYYESDASKRGQQMLTNADMYAAAVDEMNARIQANANMYAAYKTSQAQVNAARNSASSYANDLYKIYNTALRANNGNTANAFNDFANIISGQYFDNPTGKSFLEYATTK